MVVGNPCHVYAYCLMPNHVHLLICEKGWIKQGLLMRPKTMSTAVGATIIWDLRQIGYVIQKQLSVDMVWMN